MAKFKVGQIVTVTEDIACNYSGYGGRKKQIFKVGDEAVVLLPQVTKVTKPKGDKSPNYFAKLIPINFNWWEGVSPCVSKIKSKLVSGKKCFVSLSDLAKVDIRDVDLEIIKNAYNEV